MGDLASAAGSGSRIRIYRPQNFENEFYFAMPKDKIGAVVAKIEKVYSRVKLDGKDSPSHKGFCFGLLDSASNVIINSAIVPAGAVAAPRPPPVIVRRGGNQRPFDGLVAFLTHLFPYLREGEAMAYLDAAALLIVYRRGMRRFDFTSGTTAAAVETALRCAAAASNHPDQEQLVLGWKRLSPRLNRLVSELSQCSRTGHDAVGVVRNTLATTTDTNVLQLEQAWELASARCVTPMPESSLPSVRGAMKRILLSTIHGFYLQAMAMMPTAELRSRYHRSMIMGGYCYGPLDPVSNIILNTIWFDLNFPAGKQVTLDMISTNCLWRVAARSLYGLVSFLCTRYQSLTPDLAMQRLLAAGVDLRAADPYYLPETAVATGTDSSLHIGSGKPSTYEMHLEASDNACAPSFSVVDAYAAAATAAFHPDPLAHKEFLGSSNVLLESMPIQLDRMLSPENLNLLATAILKSASSVVKRHQQPQELDRMAFSYAWSHETAFMDQLHRVSKMVEAALDAFNSNNSTGPPFRLHVICGVNELVSGPEFSTDPEIKGYNPWTPYKYHHSHINFLAVPEGQQDAPATLFFALRVATMALMPVGVSL